jgi:hypothetical protein
MYKTPEVKKRITCMERKIDINIDPTAKPMLLDVAY